jgi:endonuclease YncB( thermonuclease family)
MTGRLGTRTLPMRRTRRLLFRHHIVSLLLVAAVAAAIMFTGRPPAAPLSAPPSAPALHHAISVYDGDTIRLGDERIRIIGLDTPELGHRAECEGEARAAERAKQALIGEIAQGNVALQRQGTDRYGRTLARVTVDGRDVAATLIAQGLARPYAGGRRESWCS